MNPLLIPFAYSALSFVLIDIVKGAWEKYFPTSQWHPHFSKAAVATLGAALSPLLQSPETTQALTLLAHQPGITPAIGIGLGLLGTVWHDIITPPNGKPVLIVTPTPAAK